MSKRNTIEMKDNYLKHFKIKERIGFDTLASVFKGIKSLKYEEDYEIFTPSSIRQKTTASQGHLSLVFHKLCYRGFFEKHVYKKSLFKLNYTFKSSPSYVYTLTEKGKALKKAVLALDVIEEGCLI